jgi:hypothetical protein
MDKTSCNLNCRMDYSEKITKTTIHLIQSLGLNPDKVNVVKVRKYLQLFIIQYFIYHDMIKNYDSKKGELNER